MSRWGYILDTQYPEHRTQYPIDYIYKSILGTSSILLYPIYYVYIRYIPCIYVPCLMYPVLYPIPHIPCSMCIYTAYYVCIYCILCGKKAKSCNILQYIVCIGVQTFVLMYNIDKGQGFCYNCIIIIRTASTYR